MAASGSASRSGIVSAGDPRTGRFRTAAALPGRETADGHRVMGRPDARRHIARAGRPRRAVGTEEMPLDLVGPVRRSWRTADRRDPRHAGRGVDRRGKGAVSCGSREASAAAARADAVRVERFDVPIAGAVSTLSTLPTSPGNAASRLWIGSDRGEIVRAEWSGPAHQSCCSARRRHILGARLARGAWRRVGAARGSAGTALGGHAPRSRARGAGVPQGVVDRPNKTACPARTSPASSAYGDGRLWLGHNRGLTCMEPATGVMTHFGEHDGAQGNGYAEGAWAAGESGLIYLAGEGITAFDPRQVGVSPIQAAVVFTALEILHRAVAPRWLDPDSPLERAIDAQSEVTLDPQSERVLGGNGAAALCRSAEQPLAVSARWLRSRVDRDRRAQSRRDLHEPRAGPLRAACARRHEEWPVERAGSHAHDPSPAAVVAHEDGAGRLGRARDRRGRRDPERAHDDGRE